MAKPALYEILVRGFHAGDKLNSSLLINSSEEESIFTFLYSVFKEPSHLCPVAEISATEAPSCSQEFQPYSRRAILVVSSSLVLSKVKHSTVSTELSSSVSSFSFNTVSLSIFFLRKFYFFQKNSFLRSALSVWSLQAKEDMVVSKNQRVAVDVCMKPSYRFCVN